MPKNPNAGHCRWNNPSVGNDKAIRKAAPALAELESQATTPEQKEALAAFRKSTEAQDTKEVQVKEQAAKEGTDLPDGIEIQGDGSFLCIACTEASEGTPAILKNKAGLTRHMNGQGHLDAVEALS